MTIRATVSDVGRKVKDPYGSQGVITRVLEKHDVIYVKWGYQQPQDQGFPTNGKMLDWDDEIPTRALDDAEEEAGRDEDDGGGLIQAGVIVAEAVETIAGLMGSGDGDSPASDAVEGQGGDFGGGGASADWSDSDDD